MTDLTKRDKHVPLLFLGDSTPSVTDRQLHKLLARVAAWHGLQHDCDAAISRELGRVAHQVVQDLHHSTIFSATKRTDFGDAENIPQALAAKLYRICSRELVVQATTKKELLYCGIPPSGIVQLRVLQALLQ